MRPKRRLASRLIPIPCLCLLAMAPLEDPPVNEPGGAGLDQWDPVITPAGSGALAVYLDAGPGRIDRYDSARHARGHATRRQQVARDLLGPAQTVDSLALAGNRKGGLL